MEHYKKAFQLFVSKDDYRPEFMQPFKRNGVYYATDAYSAMILPETVADLGYEEQLKPDIEKVIPKEETMNVEIKISELKDKMILELIDEEIEYGKNVKCPECEGEGTVEAEYDGKEKTWEIEVDCPKCDGCGNSEETYKRKTGKQVPNPISKYRLLDVGYQYTQLGRLIAAAELLGADTIVKTFGTRTSPSLFKVGEAKFLVMPSLMNDEDVNEYSLII